MIRRFIPRPLAAVLGALARPFRRNRPEPSLTAPAPTRKTRERKPTARYFSRREWRRKRIREQTARRSRAVNRSIRNARA